MSKILLVEDDKLISNIYKASLEKAGHEVDTLSKGSKVKNKLKGGEYDLLLLDIVLPEMNGFEVLREIDPSVKEDLKILVLSNLGQKEKIEKALNLGAGQYMIKAHYTPKEVVAKIREIMKE